MKKINNKVAMTSSPIILGMDGHPLRIEDDFRKEKLRCESRIVMYQAMKTVLAQGLKNFFKTENENK